MRDPAALYVELVPSRLAGVATVVAVVATSALVAWLPVDAWLRASAVAAVGCYGIALDRFWVQRSAARAVVALQLGADRTIAVIERSGCRREGDVQCDSYVGSALTTIVWRDRGARASRAMTILPDMLAADDFRRLRVLLRLGRPKVPSSSATTPAHR
jgi:hypothetical protein